MTFMVIEGFEVYGPTSTLASAMEDLLEKRTSLYGPIQSSTGPTFINDFESVGLALRAGDNPSAETRIVRMLIPSAFRIQGNSGSLPTYVVGFRVKIPTGSGGDSYFFQWNQSAGARILKIGVASNGTSLLTESNTDATTVDVFSGAGWYYVEVETKPTSAFFGGFLKVTVNGVLAYNSGTANIGSSSDTSNGFSLTQSEANDGTSDQWTAWDDIVAYTLDGVIHTGLIGPQRIVGVFPTSDDAPNQWSRSSGTDNFSLIDELAVDTADYVQADTSGDDDHYGLTVATGDVLCVQLDVESQSQTTAKTLHIGLDNGTASETSLSIPTAGTTVLTALHATDPSGNAWTTANFNAVEATIRRA